MSPRPRVTYPFLVANVPFSYEGDWVNGHMNGFGTYRFADGATYEGVMQNDWPNGEGTARYPNGGVYVGRWKDGKYEVTLDATTCLCKSMVWLSLTHYPESRHILE